MLFLPALLLTPSTARAQHTYLQSAFQTSDPPPWFYGTYQRKYDRARAMSLHFSGVEILNGNLNTLDGLDDVRLTSQAIEDSVAATGRELLGYWSFPRMPGFFWPTEVDAQLPAWRAVALKSDASLWTRYPKNRLGEDGQPLDNQSWIAFTGEHLDITHRPAVTQLLANLSRTFEAAGPSNVSVGPLYGYYVLNEWKLTEAYGSIWSEDPRDHDVDAPNRRMRLGRTHLELMVDDDPYYNFLHPPKRAVPLFSQGAARSFAAYAATRGFNYAQLPADRNEFNDDDASLVPLPSWVAFVPLSNTTYWSVWNDWVYETWSSFLEDVLRGVTLAQAGNPHYRGVSYFQLPAWYSLPESSSESVTYPYYDQSEVLGSATVVLRTYSEYEKLNPVVFGTNMDALLRSPWVASLQHETTKSIYTPTCNSAQSLPAQDVCVDNHQRFRHYYLAQGVLAKRVAERNGKLFQAFARAQYFGSHDALPPAEFDRSFRRSVSLLGPSTVATIGPWFIDQADLPEQAMRDVMLGQTGELQDIFAAKMATFRATSPFQLTEQPLPQQVLVEGQAAGWHVRSGGPQTPGYRWQWSATSPTSGFADLSDGAGLTGTGTPHLALASATTARSGWYRARVWNASSPAQQLFSSAGRLIVEPAGVIGEAGSVEVSSAPQIVVLGRAYANPVVIAQPPSFNGGDTSVVRITSVGSDRFTLYVHEAPNRDGAHVVETVSWLVVEAGSWTLSNGLLLQAGKLATSATVGPNLAGNWQTVTFPASFSGAPVVLSQVQTNSDSRWVKTRQRNAGSATFQLALEQHDAATAAHGAETVGWLALQPGAGLVSGRPFLAASTGAAVTSAWSTLDFGSTNLGALPVLLASITTYNEADGAALRVRHLRGRAVQLLVEEDSTADAETAHVAEGVAYLALGGTGPLRGRLAPTCTAPVVTQHPVSVTVAQGGTASFSGSASGTAPLSYQWQRNGTNVSGATSSTYTITNVQPSHAGSYRLRAWNACGSVLSNTATLTVTSGQQPYGGVPFTWPGAIELENYDTGGEGLAYHDTTAGNTGGAYRSDDVDIFSAGGAFGLGWTDVGEWTEYTGQVSSGLYDLEVRYAAPLAGRRLSLQLDAGTVFSGLSLPDTGGWGEFQTAVVPRLSLGAGSNRVLRLTQDTGSINVDWLRAQPAQPAQTVVAADTFGGVVAGGALNGRVTETGGRVWSANTSTLFGNLGNLTGTTGSHPIGTVPFDPAAYGNRAIVVEAQIAPASSGWMALGLSNHPLNGWWGVGQVWALIKPNGRFNVLANGTALSVSGGELVIPAGAAFASAAYNRVRFVYAPATRQAELWINGVQVLAPTTVPADFVPTVTHAGWSGLSVTQHTTRLDGFSVSARN